MANGFDMKFKQGSIGYEVKGSAKLAGGLVGVSRFTGNTYLMPVYGGNGEVNSPNAFYMQDNFTEKADRVLPKTATTAKVDLSSYDVD